MTQADIPTPVSDDIDPVLREFLRDTVNSFVKWDLVRFFHDNPHAADTVDNIGRYTGREIEAILHDLDGLVTSGVLERSEAGGQVIYTLTTDRGIRERVSAFVRACDDRLFRVKAIYQMLRGMH